jgi:hypothetical protein
MARFEGKLIGFPQGGGEAKKPAPRRVRKAVRKSKKDLDQMVFPAQPMPDLADEGHRRVSEIVRKEASPELREEERYAMELWKGGKLASELVKEAINVGIKTVYDTTDRGKLLQTIARWTMKKCPKAFVEPMLAVVNVLKSGDPELEERLLDIDARRYEIGRVQADPKEREEKERVLAWQERELYQWCLRRMTDVQERAWRVSRMLQEQEGEHAIVALRGEGIAKTASERLRDFGELGGLAIVSALRDDAILECSKTANEERVLNSEAQAWAKIGDEADVFQYLPSQPRLREPEGVVKASGDFASEITSLGIAHRYEDAYQTPGRAHLLALASETGSYVSAIKGLAYTEAPGVGSPSSDPSQKRAYERMSISSERALRFAKGIDAAFVRTVYALRDMQSIEQSSGEGDRMEVIRHLLLPSEYADFVRIAKEQGWIGARPREKQASAS